MPGMNGINERAARVYEAILGEGEAGRERYYRGLRSIGLFPTPAEKEGSLFAPNPVVLPRELVDAMTADLEAFCAARLRETVDPADLIATMPEDLHELFAGTEVAARILEDLRVSPPFACLDGFLVASDSGLRPAYLEWQTFPAYPVTALYCMEAIDRAFPGLADLGASFSAVAGETLRGFRERLRSFLLRGIEDDPRQGVLIDFEPAKQETSFEFDLQVDLTGGRHRGLGVIDPREVLYREGRPHYLRDDTLIPIRSVFSRLVHGDLESRLVPALSAEERVTVGRFFTEAEAIDWRVHPLHFLYGSKGDLPRFREQGLSEFIPRCEEVTAELIDGLRRSGTQRVEGRVQKPVEGHGGRDVIENPRIDELEIGCLLQDRIEAAAFHPTLNGPMTPELRVMGLSDDSGRLVCSSVFTRVKAPDEFRSNAGAIARRGVPGTGEGYALIVD